MRTKLINIIEGNASLNYESFYDFDIEKIFISYYLPTSCRRDKATTYLSLFGEEKKFLDGDGQFFVEKAWRKDSIKGIQSSIRRNNEHAFYNNVIKGLIHNIDGCEHLIIVGAMRNTASVFLKVILRFAQQQNILLTILYYAPSMYQFYDEINENQVKYFNNLISRYKNVNLIHVDFKKYECLNDITVKFFDDIAASVVYDLTSILINISKKNQIPKSVTYSINNVKSLQDYNDFLISWYRSITDDNFTSNKKILKQFFSKTIKITSSHAPAKEKVKKKSFLSKY